MAKVSIRTQRACTVLPVDDFNPTADAKILRQAMKGFGTDEKDIIAVLAYRSNKQRQQIAKEYKTMYGKDLVDDLKSETSGNFKNVLVAMMTPWLQFYAKELHRAIKGLGTNEDVLIEILCTKPNSEIMRIRKEYETLTKHTLEQDIIGDTSGIFKRLMVSLCNAGRDESQFIDLAAARADAEALYEAGEARWGTDDSTFNAVLCQRNWAQLQLVFQQYEKVAGHDIEEAVKKEFSGKAKKGLLAIIRTFKNQAAFFAKLLNNTVKGLGTDDKDLIRIIVTRSEVDMIDIKVAYEAKYGEPLSKAIKDDCSGDYRDCLLHLIREA